MCVCVLLWMHTGNALRTHVLAFSLSLSLSLALARSLASVRARSLPFSLYMYCGKTLRAPCAASVRARASLHVSSSRHARCILETIRTHMHTKKEITYI